MYTQTITILAYTLNAPFTPTIMMTITGKAFQKLRALQLGVHSGTETAGTAALMFSTPPTYTFCNTFQI